MTLQGIHPGEILRPVPGNLQGVSGHVPFYVAENVLCRQAAFPGERLQAPGPDRDRGGGLVQVAFHVGKLPQPRQQAGGRALPQGRMALPEEEEHRLVLHPAGLFWGLYRQTLRRAPRPAQAEVPDGAEKAFRRAVRHADRGPQLHEGLVENPRVRLGFRENILDLGADGFFRLREGNVAVVIRQAGDNPEDVAVHRRFPPGKGRGGDGGGGVVPDTGELQKPFVSVGKAAPFHRQLGGLLEVPGPAVVAKALPELHQVLLRCGGQGLHRGEGLQKPGVVAQHRRHPGLLKHDFRDPDAVGVPGFPPGKVPGAGPVPGQQRRREPR